MIYWGTIINQKFFVKKMIVCFIWVIAKTSLVAVIFVHHPQWGTTPPSPQFFCIVTFFHVFSRKFELCACLHPTKNVLYPPPTPPFQIPRNNPAWWSSGDRRPTVRSLVHIPLEQPRYIFEQRCLIGCSSANGVSSSHHSIRSFVLSEYIMTNFGLN